MSTYSYISSEKPLTLNEVYNVKELDCLKESPVVSYPRDLKGTDLVYSVEVLSTCVSRYTEDLIIQEFKVESEVDKGKFLNYIKKQAESFRMGCEVGSLYGLICEYSSLEEKIGIVKNRELSSCFTLSEEVFLEASPEVIEDLILNSKHLVTRLYFAKKYLEFSTQAHGVYFSLFSKDATIAFLYAHYWAERIRDFRVLEFLINETEGIVRDIYKVRWLIYNQQREDKIRSQSI